MKFRYKKYGPGVLRPVIPIEVIKNDLEVPYEVLIDSGADLCIFDAHIAEILGIDVVKGERREVSGLTGFPEFYYLHDISIKVGGLKYKVKVGFMSMRGNAYGIVGQNGFFDKFVVKFDLQKEDVELKERI
ncbi:retropepsin-like domain-containing protein [Patescibacteria group bacterium]|nr:retropepsin-like domain-containing protein [Patescibacteria group bacterium]